MYKLISLSLASLFLNLQPLPLLAATATYKEEGISFVQEPHKKNTKENKAQHLLLLLTSTACILGLIYYTGKYFVRQQLKVQPLDWRQVKVRDIKSRLDKHIVGQEEAKKEVSILLRNHLKYMDNVLKCPNDPVSLPKTNLFIQGPTGSGKTLISNCLATLGKLPLSKVDCNCLTASGYVGQSLSNAIIKGFLNKHGLLKVNAGFGIVFLDEFDKIANNPGDSGPDIRGGILQSEFLTILEGTTIKEETNNSLKMGASISTCHMLFICGGAFTGAIQALSQQNISLNTNTLRNYLISSRGFKTEFLARFPSWILLPPLKDDQLLDVLTKPENAITKQYKKLFAMEGKGLTFTSEALETIPQKALALNLGVRGVHTVLHTTLRDPMFNMSDPRKKHFTVTKQDVERAFPAPSPIINNEHTY